MTKEKIDGAAGQFSLRLSCSLLRQGFHQPHVLLGEGVALVLLLRLIALLLATNVRLFHSVHQGAALRQ